MVNKKKKLNIIKENKNLPVPASSLEKYLAEISNYKILTKEEEMKYALDTFWLLIRGAFVMWIAVGFAMLEAGLLWSKNTTAILTKNITL